VKQAAGIEGDRRSARRVRTRARLIEATRRLVAERGIEATPITDITDAAGVGVGSFYNHFATKEDLLEAVIADTIEAHGTALERLHEGMTDMAEIFAQNARLTVRRADHDPVWGWFAVRIGLHIPQLESSLGSRLARDLQRGFDSGRFESDDERTTIAMIGGAVLGAMRARLAGGLPRDADRFLATQLLVLLGVPPREAREIAGRRLPALKRLVSEQ
jgi:AcrR family transcriptional regulator